MKTLIYCTKAKPYLSVEYQEQLYQEPIKKYFLDNNKEEFTKGITQLLNGKVVGEFELNEWDLIKADYTGNYYNDNDIKNIMRLSCLNYDELKAYGKGKDLYAWYIDYLQVFDEPIELGELYKADMNDDIGSVLWLMWSIEQSNNDVYINDLKKELETRHITKAPQSYMYVYYKGEKCLLLSSRS